MTYKFIIFILFVCSSRIFAMQEEPVQGNSYLPVHKWRVCAPNSKERQTDYDTFSPHLKNTCKNAVKDLREDRTYMDHDERITKSALDCEYIAFAMKRVRERGEVSVWGIPRKYRTSWWRNRGYFDEESPEFFCLRIDQVLSNKYVEESIIKDEINQMLALRSTTAREYWFKRGGICVLRGLFYQFSDWLSPDTYEKYQARK